MKRVSHQVLPDLLRATYTSTLYRVQHKQTTWKKLHFDNSCTHLDKMLNIRLTKLDVRMHSGTICHVNFVRNCKNFWNFQSCSYIKNTSSVFFKYQSLSTALFVCLRHPVHSSPLVIIVLLSSSSSYVIVVIVHRRMSSYIVICRHRHVVVRHRHRMSSSSLSSYIVVVIVRRRMSSSVVVVVYQWYIRG